MILIFNADIARIAAKCLAVVEAHDRALEDDVAVTVAQKKYDNILDSPSLDAALSKIDDLAKKKQLDSTLMLLLAKAWATAKESNTMTEEVWYCFQSLGFQQYGKSYDHFS